MARTYRRGDQFVATALLLHALVALALAAASGAWVAPVLVSGASLGVFAWCRSRFPASFLTRSVAALALQAMVALHVEQMPAVAEMHYFFFTSLTVLMVGYQDWRCLWPSVLGIFTQHGAALLSPGDAEEYFAALGGLGSAKLSFHFGIAAAQVFICMLGAHLLRQQTLAGARVSLRLCDANEQLRNELVSQRLGFPPR